jgi:hypothetical protein
MADYNFLTGQSSSQLRSVTTSWSECHEPAGKEVVDVFVNNPTNAPILVDFKIDTSMGGTAPSKTLEVAPYSDVLIFRGVTFGATRKLYAKTQSGTVGVYGNWKSI